MKIYTKTGDKGETSLVSGKRVLKSDLRLNSYGEIDELNCYVGLVLSDGQSQLKDYQKLLSKIQNELFVAGSLIATEKENREKFKLPKLSEELISELEKAIDNMNVDLPELKNFILPGGCELASVANICRVVCRRVERTLVLLEKTIENEVPQTLLKLINRLSDFFFVLGRWANFHSRCDEVIWVGRG